MRVRPLLASLGILAALALVGSACGGGGGGGAGRAVDDDWDAQAAIVRSRIIEQALDDGLKRSATSCLLREIEGEIDLQRVADFDLSARTGSGTTTTEAALLADALVACGPSIGSMLRDAAPGSAAIPDRLAPTRDCFRNAYQEAIRDSYAERFRSVDASGPHEIDIRELVRGCDAAGALLVGASNEGHVETAALGTLEWECLTERLPSFTLERAFPFPDEPGDALERLGSTVEDHVAFCEAWVSGDPIAG